MTPTATLPGIERLVAGDQLTAEEFLRRWEAMPELKRAELVGGLVFMGSPVGPLHGDTDADVLHWASSYTDTTPGCRASGNATCRILDQVPQPDVLLRILESHGGRTRAAENCLIGAPELVVEICHSSVAYDLRLKKELYARGGVDEYVAVLLREREVRWHRLEQGTYRLLEPATGGIFRSVLFPGLWLDAPALLDGRMPEILKTLQAGVDSPEHRAFVERLQKARG